MLMMSRQKKRVASLIASAAFACTAAFAQTSAPPSATAPSARAQAESPEARPQHPHMDPAQRFERMRAHRAQRLAELKQKLQLNAGQEGAWNSFAAAQQPPARSPGQMRTERAEFARLTTPQRLERMQARHAERNARFTERVEATRNFYAT
jgi:hypothetical protein